MDNASALRDLHGLDIDFSITPLDVTEVEIVSASGTETVNICNEPHYKPIYFNKSLNCMNGMSLIKYETDKTYCCTYSDIKELPEPKQNQLAGYLQSYQEWSDDNVIYSNCIAILITDLMTRQKIIKLIPKLGSAAFSIALKPLLSTLISKNLEQCAMNTHNFNILEKMGGPFKSLKKLLADGAEKIGLKALKESIGTGIKDAKKFLGMGKRFGQVFSGFNIIMDIEMVFELLGWFLERYDVGGFHQYQDNKTIILIQRDLYEGILLNSMKSVGIDPPYVFNLGNIKTYINKQSASGTHTSTPEDFEILQDISLNYTDAFKAYHLTLGAYRNDIDMDDIASQAAFLNGEITKLSDEFLERITPTINDNPDKRDNYVWDYLKNHLKSINKDSEGNPKYLLYKKNMTNKDIVGISLNQSGIDIYNRSISEDDIPVIISKHFRDIKSLTMYGDNPFYVLEQHTLNDDFPLLSNSFNIINKMCTVGMDPDKLPGKDMRKDSIFPLLSEPENVIAPSDYNVTYNINTGLCNFSQEWCSFMGMDNIKTEYFPGDEPNSFDNCDEASYQKVIGFLLPHLAIEEIARHT